MTNHELEGDLPAYLVFLILGLIKELEKSTPDHILVKAVRGALDSVPPDNPKQMSFDF